MSFWVALPRKSYPDGALDAFDATGGLSIDNARAMMWLVQLAYDTPERTKVEDVLRAWQMPLQAFVSNDPATGLPRASLSPADAARPSRPLRGPIRSRSGLDHRFHAPAVCRQSPYQFR